MIHQPLVVFKAHHLVDTLLLQVAIHKQHLLLEFPGKRKGQVDRRQVVPSPGKALVIMIRLPPVTQVRFRIFVRRTLYSSTSS